MKCGKCLKPISAERLVALPATGVCIKCAGGDEIKLRGQLCCDGKSRYEFEIVKPELFRRTNKIQ